ncbi:MAG: PDZ domain-containing protein [Gemmatimonadota bacterium]
MRFPTFARWPVLAGAVHTMAVLAVAGCASRAPLRPSIPETPVNYYVRVDRATVSSYDVSVAFDEVNADSIDFYLPGWTPGRYEADRRPEVESFSVREGHGEPIAMRRLDARRWRIYPGRARYVTIGYRVPTAVDPEAGRAFATLLELRGGYVTGAALFGTLLGHESRPVQVSFEVPRGWSVVTALRELNRNRWSGASFDVLPGTLFALGDRMTDYKLFVAGKPHQVVIQGAPGGFAPDSLLRLVSETIELGTRFYGAPPYERYLFAFHFVEPGVTGLGATGQATGASFFLPPMDGDQVRQAGVGSLLLHQYLHAWYPGAFGPAALLDPNFLAPPDVPGAWFLEGAAEYYARLLPVRYGGGDTGSFYEAMGELLTVWRQMGHGGSVDPAALRPDTADEAEIVVGGALAAMVIDIAVHGDTRGQRGLDELLAFLQRGTPVGGYHEGVWAEAATSLGMPQAALSPLVTGSRLSIESGLARAGLRMATRSEARQTLGARLVVEAASGTVVPDPQSEAVALEFGVPYAPARHFVVRDVESNGTAASAGLRDGDILLRINDTPVGPDETIATRYALRRYVREAPAGSPVAFDILRGGVPMEREGAVRRITVSEAEIQEVPGSSAAALVVRTGLLDRASTAASR